MWNSSKKILHKRILMCMGIPFTREHFARLYHQENSDFIKSLKKTYRVNDLDSLWKKYKKIAKEAKKTIDKYAKHGASVVDNIDLSEFQSINNYDVVILIAHHPEQENTIEINGNSISENDFIKYFPNDFEGILDLTSCYSTNLQYMLKAQCASPSFHTLAVDNKTSLAFRLVLLERVIDELCTKDIDYITAYQRAIDFINKILPEGKSITIRDIIYLGGEIKSTIFAPAQVTKGDSFMVQLFIHKKSEDETVEIIAKCVDEASSIRNFKSLPIKLKRNDKIETELSWQENNKDLFTVDKKRKSTIWTNEPASIDYCINVSKECTDCSFIGRIKIAVNKQNAGEILFKTDIVTSSTKNDNSTNIDFIPYLKSEEINSESDYLHKKLDQELFNLNSSLEHVSSENDINVIKHKIKICKKLYQILDNSPDEINKSVVKVFISSTADMIKYRDILKKQITELKMFPVSYDNWTQEDLYPRDVCCKEVMASDIFVCILGAKYGFIEPEWSMSMTEIEYRVAVLSGLPILVYIVEDYEKQMTELPDAEKEYAKKQKRLIEELKTKRLVELFKSDLFFQMKSCEELTRLKTQLELSKN